MPEPREHHRHIALWIAVGGTVAAVVALWALILPTQMRQIRLVSDKDRSRWSVVASDEGERMKAKPLGDILQEQRAKLDELEVRMREAVTGGTAAQAKVDDLTAKIEAASKEQAKTDTVPTN